MTDPFEKFTSGLDSPAKNGVAITPHDTNDLTNATRGIYVGGAGDVKVDMVGTGTVTFSNAVAGSVLPIRAARVYDTGTTATLLIGLF